jgi:hypothetical protein
LHLIYPDLLPFDLFLLSSLLFFFIPDPNFGNIVGPLVAQIEDAALPHGAESGNRNQNAESGWWMDDGADNARRTVSSATKATVNAGMDSMSSYFRLCSRCGWLVGWASRWAEHDDRR